MTGHMYLFNVYLGLDVVNGSECGALGREASTDRSSVIRGMERLGVL